jgi:hypothetical protein
MIFAWANTAVLVSLLLLASACTYTLYQLSSSHGVDLAGREHAVVISSTALLAYAIGAIAALGAAGPMFDRFPPQALFAQNFGIQSALSLFVGWDLWRHRRPVATAPAREEG